MALVTITRGPWVINTALLTSISRISDTRWNVTTSTPAAFSLTADECQQLGYSAGDLGEAGDPPDSDGLVLSQLSTIVYEDTDYEAANSFQPVGIDLNLAAGAGSSADPKYIAPIMGNVIGDTLTKTKSYIGALIGKLSVIGAKLSTYPWAAVVAEVGDGVTAADGSAVVAVVGGDSAQTGTDAAFSVDYQNSTAGSGFDYIVRGARAAHDGYLAAQARKGFAVVALNAGGLPVGIYFGVATDDAGIVAQVGADNTIADGSLYISILDNAGKLFQKQNDVWIDLQA